MRTSVKQYPSILSWKSEGTPPSQDGDGNVVPGIPETEFNSKCRYENFDSGNRKEFTGVNGKTVLATGRVFIKFGEALPERFVVGVITTEGREIYKGEIINTFEGQMNKTIYTIEDVRS